MSESVQADESNPFADSRVRTVIGLSGGISLILVAFLVVEDPMLRWLMVAIAAVDVVATPYMLKYMSEQGSQ